jgi:hypothetical protein
MSTDDTPQHPPNPYVDAEHWHKTALRQAMEAWEPKTMAEARHFTMECVGRAEALAAVLVEYAWREPTEWSTMRQCVELIDDLCHLAYAPMMDLWQDEEELQRRGWQPPTGEGPRKAHQSIAGGA